MENAPEKKSEAKDNSYYMGVFWWTTLTVAVLAVPCFGIVVSYIFPFRGLGGLIVFILACWLCTYLGMRLMSNPKMADKIGMQKKDG
jgi:FtsH-binding integral membrane protein